MSLVSGSNGISSKDVGRKGLEPRSRRRIAVYSAAAVALATAAAGVGGWKHSVDRSPFTATVTGAAPVTGQAVEGGACTPNLAGETVVVYDASGKRKLGSAVQPSRGEVLASDFGDVAGWCFHATRVMEAPRW